MTLALQLLTHNDSVYLPYVLESLAQQADKDWELWTLDNSTDIAERDQVRHTLDSYSDRLKIHAQVSDTNTGFAGGHQILYQQHCSDLILLVNVDVILDPNYIETVRREMSENAGIGASSGHILRWHLNEGDVVRTEVTDTLGLERLTHEMVRDIGGGSMETCKSQDVFGLSGCLPMYRRSAIDKSTPNGRLFDPEYHLYKEDVDLAYYLHNAGWASRIVDGTKAYHYRTFKDGARLSIPNWVQRQSYRNHLWNLIKHIQWHEWLTRGWAIVLYELAKATYLGVKMPKDVWQAWKETAQNWKKLRSERSYVRR
jgi:N-acetylglucosaminyl-diphospho-decaprenol L-rhamnosyltransferase